MSSKKIAVVTPVFPPYRGGIGNVAYQHARLLAERGEEVTVLTPAYAKASAGKPDYNFKLELLKPVFKYGNAAWVPSLEKRLEEFDVVILEYPFFGGAGAVYQAKKKYGLKLVVYYHMDVVGSGLKGLIFKYNTRWFLPRLIKAADVVLTSSADYAQRFSKSQVLAIGVDLEKFSFSDQTRERMILFVGGLDKAHYFKGVEYLIRAVALLLRPRSSGGSNLDNASNIVLSGSDIQRDVRIATVVGTLPRNDSDFKLVITGKGELISQYQKLAQDLGVADKVEFTGGVSDDELVRLYQRAAVTVLPSIDQSEAFGLVLVESMACGTPVIASDLPGVRSVFENGVSGFTVLPRDSQALAERLQYALDYPAKMREMGAAGRKLVEQKYNWEVIGDKLELNIN